MKEINAIKKIIKYKGEDFGWVEVKDKKKQKVQEPVEVKETGYYQNYSSKHFF